MKTKSRSILAAAGFGGAVAAAAFLGSQFNPGQGDIALWYDGLEKPPFTPPKAVFPVAWTTLYTMMTISAWRVWKHGEDGERGTALALWWTQLALNAAWSPLFFAKRDPELALVDLGALFVAIAAYTRSAFRNDRAAGVMMVPYLGWVAFAGALNAEIVRRNG